MCDVLSQMQPHHPSNNCNYASAEKISCDEYNHDPEQPKFDPLNQTERDLRGSRVENETVQVKDG